MKTIKFELEGIYETGDVFLNGKHLDLDKSLKLVNHSPSGFSWGYGGLGPAQLALAILYELTNDKDFSIRNHQKLKFDFVSKLPQSDFHVIHEITYSKDQSHSNSLTF